VTQGISHTRSVNHGGATERNAHPHVGGLSEVDGVRNRVIVKYGRLRLRLHGEVFGLS
jgi:glucosamine--fructose-6-phosphate aminotransferase (isomerizing)